MGLGLAVIASEVALYSGGGGGGLWVMSDLEELRARAKEVIGKTSSWQRWLTLLLKTATSELPAMYKNSQNGECGQR